MKRLTGTVRTYSWGSYDAIPDILGKEADGKPWAEYWLGAHETSPSTLDGIPLTDYIHAHPDELGDRSDGGWAATGDPERGGQPDDAVRGGFPGER